LICSSHIRVYAHSLINVAPCSHEKSLRITRLKSPGPFVSRLRDQERLYVLWVTLEWIMQITIYNIPIKKTLTLLKNLRF